MNIKTALTANPETPKPSHNIWGIGLAAGFQRVPDVLIKNQSRLRLSALDVLIILNLGVHWWTADNRPYPTIGRIARRIGVSRRSVERRIRYLEDRRLVSRMNFEVDSKGKKIRRFDLSNLVKTVEHYAERDSDFNLKRLRSVEIDELAATGSKLVAGLRPST